MASTISGFVAVVAVGALNALAGSAQTVNRMTETTSEIRFAAHMMARDLANLYRDPNPQNMKLLGSSEGTALGGPPFLTFYITGRAKARANQPESDVYEVEYFLGTRQQQTARTEESSEDNTVLFKVNPGLEVRIIDRAGEWVQATASEHIAGWIEKKRQVLI